jgi:uncharacterized protein (TIGR02118 family)
MGTHLVFLYRRRADIGHEQFLCHWRDIHAPLVAAVPSIRRYVRDVVLPADGLPLRWHGAEELWLDDEQAADALMRDPQFVEGALADERNFIDTACVVRLRTIDHPVLSGEPIAIDDSYPKRMTFLKRKPGMTREQLLEYWRHVHGPLAGSVPGVRRYVQSAVVPSGYAAAEPDFDGVAQIWLRDADALRAVVSSSLFRDQVKPDEANFVATELTLTLPMQEDRVVWPTSV